jgi:hypothetical protein
MPSAFANSGHFDFHTSSDVTFCCMPIFHGLAPKANACDASQFSAAGQIEQAAQHARRQRGFQKRTERNAATAKQH